MKKLFSLLLVVIPFIGETQNVEIPDSIFKKYLVGNKKINTNGDSEIQLNEASGFRDSIDCFNLGIRSLKGIEAFIALTYLNCGSNQLKTLDVSNNLALTVLDCGFDLSRDLSGMGNQLTTLDVSRNTSLIRLNCSVNNLVTLDLSKNAALTSLDCYDNNLVTLDLSKNAALTSLFCEKNNLATIDLSKNVALTYLNCGNNNLATLDVRKNLALERLWCIGNQLTSLDLSKNAALTSLFCGNNNLATLDLSKNAALTKLFCEKNNLATIDLSKNVALTYLSCGNNNLATLDLSKNAALTSLFCEKNNLATLDLSKNAALTSLDCYDNNLVTLDLSKNAALTSLNCWNNNLATLDVSKNLALERLWCWQNKLRMIDASKNSSLTNLRCDSNVVVQYSQTIRIGTQEWMKENLNVSTFRNGDPIPEAKTNEEWKRAGESKKPAWCYYQNDPANGAKYGKLYNWYAVVDSRGIAPEGYHVPSNDEWGELEDFLGGYNASQDKMKSTFGWKESELSGNGSNSSGFSGHPGGNRHIMGAFSGSGEVGYWWSLSSGITVLSSPMTAAYSDDEGSRNNADVKLFFKNQKNHESYGLSVRCLKD
jgi:uncharacterized protein (TIGR02145 family)